MTNHLASVVCFCLLSFSLVLSHPSSDHAHQHGLAEIQVQNIQYQWQEGALLTVDQPVINGTSGWVTVSWSNIANASSMDWIGVYLQEDNFQSFAPVKYSFITNAGPVASSGSDKFFLVNPRKAYTFVYFKGGKLNPIVVAKSKPVSFDNYERPSQLHLAYTENLNEMRVNWVTRAAKQPAVVFGKASGVYTQMIEASTSTYTKDQMCGYPANSVGWYEPGLIHTAVLPKLDPATVYYYIVGDLQQNGEWSEEYSFQTRGPVGPTDTPFKFVLFGDLGQASAGDINVEDHVVEVSALNTTQALFDDLNDGGLPLSTVVLHIGDISYARGYASDWEFYFHETSPISSRLPWMTCLGNHERDFPSSGSLFTGQDSGGECGVPYDYRYPMPKATYDAPWYSFDYNSIHFVLISTEHDFSQTSAQWKWLEADLAAVDRSVTPWVMLAGHRPMYIDSTNFTPAPGGGDQGVAYEMQTELEMLFQQYQIDVAFWGHHHSYQRTCRVYNNTCVSDSEFGTLHIVSGAAGYDNSNQLINPKPEIFDFVDATTHGYMRGTVAGDAFTLEYVAGANREVLDTYTLTRKDTRKSVTKRLQGKSHTGKSL